MKIKYLISTSGIFLISIAAFFTISHRNTHEANAVNYSTVSNLTVSNSQATNSTAANAELASITSNDNWMNDEVNVISAQATNLNPKVLKLSLIAYQHAENKGITTSPLLTIVDYSKPSTENRLWVIDTKQKKVLVNTLVAHGKNSGDVYASSFSNRPESLESSLGVYLTEEPYSGKHGNSLHIQGLESGFNDNAYKRSIVFHGAEYVSASIAKAGRIGRSWGCLAVNQNIIGTLVNLIKNKVLVVAYYPDKNWLGKSVFLH